MYGLRILVKTPPASWGKEHPNNLIVYLDSEDKGL